MDTLRDKFTNIRKLDELQPYLVETKDGETPTLEFKSLRSDSFSGDSVGRTKAKLAKEVCAFLNTNDGMILWGGDIDKATGKAVIANDSGENLAAFLDDKLLTLIEPAPKGIDYHKIEDDNGNEALLIFVPRSDFAPHRVGSWDAEDSKKGKDKIIGRYFQRVGTNSQAMPENLVRSMYLSNGRVPIISIHTAIEIPRSHPDIIYLKTIVSPDSYKFIPQYHNINQIAIMTSMSNIKLNGFDEFKRLNVWHEIHGPYINLEPIYPKNAEYTLSMSSILSDGDIDFDEEQERADGNLHLTPQLFSQIFAIATKSTFACDAVPLVIKNRLYILGNSQYWYYEDYDLERLDILSGIEKDFNTEIYVAKPYRNDLIDDRGVVNSVKDDGKIRVSQIVGMLESLQKFVRTE